jgi:UDP-glucose 4-epimerase
MRVLVTGSSGRIGRAIVERLRQDHEQVRGLDRLPAPTTDVQGDLTDPAVVAWALRGIDAVVHTAALHAPHVGRLPEARFEAVNVQATAHLALRAAERGVRHLVFTSTTALFGAQAGAGGEAAWVTESTPPVPRTVYHRTKLAAEARLADQVAAGGVPVKVLRMSRCFPEPADHMAVYRLHRGVDARPTPGPCGPAPSPGDSSWSRIRAPLVRRTRRRWAGTRPR